MLSVYLVDEAALFKLSNDAVIDDVIEFERSSGLAAHGFLDLNLRSFASHERNAVEKLGIGGPGGFQELRIALPSVLGDELHAVLLAGFHEVRRLDQRHCEPSHGFAVAC